MTINTVSLVGYVGQNPDVRYFESGKVLCKFPIVVESVGDNDGALHESIDLELWNKTAEVAAKYALKGRLIGITGSLKFSNWLDRKTGKTRNQPIILVNQIYLLGAKVDNHPSPSPAFTPTPNQNSKSPSTQLSYQNPYEGDQDNYECEENSDEHYYQKHEEFDTSVDYGYLDDTDNVYEYFHSLGEYE